MNIAAIQEELKRHHIDGWLFFDHHQRDPFAYRVLGLSTTKHVTRRWYYFIPAEGQPRGLVHRIEAFMIDELPGEKIPYSSWQEQFDCLAKILKGSKRVAMQYSPSCAIPYVATVDAGTVELVRSTGVEVVSSADLVQAFEARLSDEAIESHLEAGKLMDKIRAQAFKFVSEKTQGKSTVSEFEVKQFLLEQFKKNDLITAHGPDVAANGNSSNPHYDPTEAASHKIGRGDFVLIDMWAKLNRPGAIYYDITWTGFCGAEIPSQIKEVFRIVREARDAAIQKVITTCSNHEILRGFEVDDAARKIIVDEGYGKFFFHRTGHSIGEEVHGNGANMDNLESNDQRIVINNSSFSIEPGIYLKEFGIRSEVNMLVRESGAQVTGEVQEELLVL